MEEYRDYLERIAYQNELDRLRQEAYDQWAYGQWARQQYAIECERDNHFYADDTDLPWDDFQPNSNISF